MNPTPGTALWAIQQLLAGKKITYKDWPEKEYGHMIDGKIFDEKGNKLDFSIFESDDTDWQLWTPPNPYSRGSFAWAWEELNRGNKVIVHEINYSGSKPMIFFKDGPIIFAKQGGKDTPWSTNMMHVDLINSTNWKLA